jgi:hypothetical protein
MISKNKLLIHFLFSCFFIFFSQKSLGVSEISFLKRSCPYEGLKNTSCVNSQEDQKIIKNSFQLFQTSCQIKLKSPICQKTTQTYPFLSQSLNGCTAEDACGFPYVSNQHEARESCQKGFESAYKELGKDFSQSAKQAEQFLLNLGDELKKVLSESSRFSWDLIRDCFKDKAACSPSKIKEYIESMPEQIRNEISEMFQSMDQFECLNSQGRIQLLCYQTAMQSSGLAMNAVPGRLVSRIGKKIIGVESKAISATTQKTNLLSIPEKGIERLEKALGRKVDVVIEYKGSRLRPLYKIKDPESGKIMGTLSVNYDSSGKTIHIGTMETMKEFRQMGVGETLFESALQQFPDTEYVSVESLEDTNLDVVRDHIAKGMSLEDAIKETPAYKIRSKMGFGEILPQSINRHSFGFKVKKMH